MDKLKIETTVFNRVSIEDLPNVLNQAANGNMREGFIRVYFTQGDYSGGNDAPVVVDLVMTESISDPFINEG